MKQIKIKINNQEIICSSDKTIFKVARENGIFIPGLCGHPDFPPKANCRLCVVEIKGRNKLETACSTKVEDGMEITTNSERVKKTRNLNLELIFAEHIEKCPTCIWRVNCALLNFADRYKVEISHFKDRKGRRKIYKFANAVEIDGSQCIDCRNCLDACSLLQKINYLELKGKGHRQEVVPVKDHRLGRRHSGIGWAGKKIDCIYCGQCAVHCPVGAAQEQSHWEMVESVLKNKKKIVVAQFAPSIRVSIGEEFGLPYGKIVTGQVVAGLKALGFNNIFDVTFGADVTTMVEAEELLERLKRPHPNLRRSPRLVGVLGPPLAKGREFPLLTKEGVRGRLPMMTSCCPAWVKYVEFYHPELISNLTTARSPHVHSAGIIKTYWAQKMKINPKNIVVVSVMPCTAKKFEADRAEMKIKGRLPVDLVITTREFAWLMKKNNVDFAGLKPIKADNPLGEYSGAAVIYGGSGGVMESALRTAQFLACTSTSFSAGKNSRRQGGTGKSKFCDARLEFKDVRGLEGIKEAAVDVAGKKIRVAVVNGIGNIKPVIENLKKYDYIEVMACPGGCIGGGGQPIPTTPEIRKKRIESLYKIDKSKKIRKAHENEGVLKVLEWLKKQGKLEHGVLHTNYKKR